MTAQDPNRDNTELIHRPPLRLTETEVARLTATQPNSTFQSIDQVTRLINQPPTQAQTVLNVATEAEMTDSAGLMQARRPGYVLRRMFAQGGQGELWSAIQTSLQREIAVKILSQGDPVEFLHEAYTTGELDHPNIVPVYDLGVAEIEKRPKHALAMKYVRGEPWNRLLQMDREDRKLSTEDMLAKHLPILVSVCNAVAFAHSKGIIHRDLKPHQVLIGSFGEVYLVDWGLAIAVDLPRPFVTSPMTPRLRTLETATNGSGTPAYMAPEQTMRDAHVLGFHTDIYLLGAILYDLLAGRPPHAAENGSAAYFKASLNEFEKLPAGCPPDLRNLVERSLADRGENRPRNVIEFRAVLEDHLSGAGRRRESIALSTSVAEAMEARKNAATYEMLLGLGRDVARSLELWSDNTQARALRDEVTALHGNHAAESGDLQLARSLAMQLSDSKEKAALLSRLDTEVAQKENEARQRRVARTASVVLLILVMGLWVVFMRRELHSTRNIAINRERALEAESRAESQRERAQLLDRINRLRSEESKLGEAFAAAFPFPRTIEIPNTSADAGDASRMLADQREQLRKDRAALLKDKVPLDPEPMQLRLGEANQLLHEARDKGAALRAYAFYEVASHDLPGQPEPLTGMGIAAMRAGYHTSGSLLLAQAADITREVRGAKHPDTAQALLLAADAYRQLDDTAEAYKKLYRESLAVLEPSWQELSLTLSETHLKLGEAEMALAYSSPTLQVERVLNPKGSLAEASALQTSGDSLENLGRLREAQQFFERAYALRRSLDGEDSPQTLQSLQSLGSLMLSRSEITQARETYLKVMKGLETRFGVNDAHLVEVLENLSYIEDAAGEEEQSRAYIQRALDICEQVYGPEHPSTARILLRAGTLAADEERMLEAIDIQRRLLGEDHPTTLASIKRLAFDIHHLQKNAYADSEALLRYVINRERRRSAIGSPNTGDTLTNLAIQLHDLGRLSEAEAMYLEAYAADMAQYQRITPSMWNSFYNLAENQWLQDHFDEAEVFFLRAMDLTDESTGVDEFFPRARQVLYYSHNLKSRIAAGKGKLDDARRILVMMRWTDSIHSTALPTLRPGQFVSEAVRRYLLIGFAAMHASPPNKKVASNMVSRTKIILDHWKVPDDSEWRIEWLDPMSKELGLDWSQSLLPTPPDGLATLEDGRIFAADFEKWLDSHFPRPEWESDFPGFEWTLQSLTPRGPELTQLADKVIAQRREAHPREDFIPAPWMQALYDGRAQFLLREYESAGESYQMAMELTETGLGSNALTKEAASSLRQQALLGLARADGGLNHIEEGWKWLTKLASEEPLPSRNPLSEDEGLAPFRTDTARFEEWLKKFPD